MLHQRDFHALFLRNSLNDTLEHELDQSPKRYDTRVHCEREQKPEKKNKNQANLKVRSHSKKRFDRDVGLLDINDFGCQNIHNK